MKNKSLIIVISFIAVFAVAAGTKLFYIKYAPSTSVYNLLAKVKDILEGKANNYREMVSILAPHTLEEDKKRKFGKSSSQKFIEEGCENFYEEFGEVTDVNITVKSWYSVSEEEYANQKLRYEEYGIDIRQIMFLETEFEIESGGSKIIKKGEINVRNLNGKWYVYTFPYSSVPYREIVENNCM